MHLLHYILGDDVDNIKQNTLYYSLVAVSNHEKREERRQTKGRERARRFVVLYILSDIILTLCKLIAAVNLRMNLPLLRPALRRSWHYCVFPPMMAAGLSIEAL